MTHRHIGDSLKLTTQAPMKIDYRKIFKVRLYNLRVGRELPQAAVARGTGIAKDMISRYERGLTFPGPVNVKKLADFFGVEPEALWPPDADDLVEGIVDATTPGITRMSVVENDSIYSVIVVQQMVFTSTALKIMKILKEDAEEQARLSNGNDGSASN